MRAALLSLFFAWTVAAQTNPVVALDRSITLNEAIELALKHNLDLQLVRLEPQRAEFALAGSYGVYDPNIGLSAQRNGSSSPSFVTGGGISIAGGERETTSVGISNPGISAYLPTGGRITADLTLDDQVNEPNPRQISADTGISLSQPLLRDLLIDGPRATIQINKKALSQSEWQVRQRVMEILYQVEEAYYNLIFTRENVKVQETALELANQLLRENKKRVEVGALAPLDEKQAEAEVASTRAELIDAKRQLAVQQNTLKSLLTDKYAEWAGINLAPSETLLAIPVNADLLESWRRGLTLRPELHSQQLNLEITDINLRLAKNNTLPALDLNGGYGHNSGIWNRKSVALRNLKSDDFRNYSYGLTLSFPLGNRAARNEYRRTKVTREQEELRLKQLEQQILLQIEDSIRLIESDFQRVAATRSARVFAEEALRAEQRKLESGKSTSFLVLQFQRDLTRARFQEIQALADYNKSLAQLALYEGTMLDRHKLSTTLH
ncbi:MAG: TolC family protein [Verrucomicrobiota bacterium]|nr:TolC family protein [Verrucomicrobiota bacterium]